MGAAVAAVDAGNGLIPTPGQIVAHDAFWRPDETEAPAALGLHPLSLVKAANASIIYHTLPLKPPQAKPLDDSVFKLFRAAEREWKVNLRMKKTKKGTYKRQGAFLSLAQKRAAKIKGKGRGSEE